MYFFAVPGAHGNDPPTGAVQGADEITLGIRLHRAGDEGDVLFPEPVFGKLIRRQKKSVELLDFHGFTLEGFAFEQGLGLKD